jgi:phosphoserine aminotransferase
MTRVHNFSAGPATLPLEVLQQAQQELVDYQGHGFSLIEASHRGKEYEAVHNEAIRLIKSILNVPDTHHVLFLGGGASMQFGMVPMNLINRTTGGDNDHSDHLLTGSWGKKALSDARKIAPAELLFDGSDSGFTTLPEVTSIQSTPGSAYLHLTSNETIEGLQWKEFPATDAPLVADMSSDIFSRPIAVDQFGLIYAGAQKNLGPAGVTIVIIREDLLDRAGDNVPAYLTYRSHSKSNSLYNTPPVFPIYMVKLVLEWIEHQGGLDQVAKNNTEKAAALYEAIEGSHSFYRCPVDPRYRSQMNVVFRLPTEDLEQRFVKEAAVAGMTGLKGHRSVGGIRASIYNAMPRAGVNALIAFMQQFSEVHGGDR